jgi:lipid A 3-O-deacylase
MVRFPFLVALALIGFTATARADNCQIRVHEENDTFTDTDESYTQGLRVDAFACLEFEWATRGLRWLGNHTLAMENPAVSYGFSIGENIYTPRNIGEPDVVLSDRPYAAWLYLAAQGRIREGRNVWDFEFDLGVTGDPALGRELQGQMHVVLNISEARGWAHQIAPALTMDVSATWNRMLVDWHPDGWGLPGDLVAIDGHVKGRYGDIFRFMELGTSVMLGHVRSGSIHENIPAIRLTEKTPTEHFWEAFVFLRANARGVAHNGFLSGVPGTVSPHTVKARPLVFDGDLGVAGTLGPVTVGVSVAVRSTEEYVNRWRFVAHRYGQIQVTYTPEISFW